MSEWVKVSEKLPEVFKVVLLWVPDHDFNHMFVGYLGSATYWFVYQPHHEEAWVTPTHWMPLPGAPDNGS